MCGIVGVMGTSQAAEEVYQALLVLQHRGQDAAGILSYNFERQEFHLEKNQGLVEQVFKLDAIRKLSGRMAIGHTRYATVGNKKDGQDFENIQPLMMNFPHGLGMCHNGNLVNFYQLIDYLKSKQHRFVFSSNDLEVLLNLISEKLVEHMRTKFEYSHLQEAAQNTFEKAEGGYSVLGLIADKGLFAFKDPNAIRPLLMGKKTVDGKDAYCFASESTVLDYLGYKVLRDLNPGEIVFVDTDGNISSTHPIEEPAQMANASPCMFEWVYFSNPESTIYGKGVYQVRLKLGHALGNKIKPWIESGLIKPDVIVPVPDSGRISALGMSEVTGIPFRELLIKNRYIHRSFILSSQEKRKKAVQLKLMPVADEIRGKNILLVDDSIVRGTTSRRIVELVKEAGAKEVYFASTCPPIKHSCYFGIDFPDSKELIAANTAEKEIALALNCEAVIYNEISAVAEAIALPKMCQGCLTGKYPFEITKESHTKFTEMRTTDRGNA